MIDEYTSVAGPAHAETKVMGSRFLALLAPAGTPDDALRELETVRKAYHDASHHCYAYRVGPEGSQERYNDAGEPSGTAGKPLLLVLQHAALSDAVLIVTRYFGGTRLGVGGLRRAYAGAGQAAVDRARKVCRILTEEMRVVIPVALIGEVISAVTKAGGRIVRTEYVTEAAPGGGVEARLAIEVRRSRAEDVRLLLIDRTSGNARLLEP